jgi:hypothetical protein
MMMMEEEKKKKMKDEYCRTTTLKPVPPLK